MFSPSTATVSKSLCSCTETNECGDAAEARMQIGKCAYGNVCHHCKCRLCAWDSLPLTAPSPHSTCLRNRAQMQKCPPLVDAPRLACLDSTLFPGTGGPWRPMGARGPGVGWAIQSFMQGGGPPGAWLLKECPCGSGIM